MKILSKLNKFALAVLLVAMSSVGVVQAQDVEVEKGMQGIEEAGKVEAGDGKEEEKDEEEKDKEEKNNY